MNTLAKRNEGGRVNPWLRDFFNVENMFNRDLWNPGNTLPAVNVSEDDKTYYVDVMAPGYKKEDFKINVDDDALTISAETKSETSEEDKNRQYSRREYSYNSFTRSFRLPENAKNDAIDATYKDGILKLNVPKTKPETKATKEIKVS
jgi:HSP20 family protein